jgi:hypothetical protein
MPRPTRNPTRTATGTDIEQSDTLQRRGTAPLATPGDLSFAADNTTTRIERGIYRQVFSQSPTGGGDGQLRLQEQEGAIRLNTMRVPNAERATPDGRYTDAYTPIDCPEGFAKLDFRPVILKSGVTIGLAMLYSVIIAGIVAVTYCGNDSANYAVINPNIYFGARFGPSIIGTVTTVLVRSFLQEFCRMLPYINMADPRPGSRGQSWAHRSVAALYFPTLGINTREGKTLLLLQTVTTPLMALKLGLVEVLESTDGWTVIIHPVISNILILYYIIQILALCVVTVWLWNRDTGLRSDWDPTSLADIIALFQHFNVVPSFFAAPAGVPAHLLPLREFQFRLGYWEHTPVRRNRLREGLSRPQKKVVYGIRALPNADGQLGPPSKSSRDSIHEAEEEQKIEMYYPYRLLPILNFGVWFTLGYYILGVCLLIAMVATAVLGLMERMFTIDRHGNFGKADATLELTHVLDRNMSTSRIGFTWFRGPPDEINRLLLWNFILRMLPTAVASTLIFMSVIFDRFHLYTQPLVEMYNGPSSAEKTILLDYLTLSPLAVLLQAWNHRHWKVLYFATLSLLGPALQLIPAGILLLTSKDDIIYGSFSKALLISAIVILSVYLASYIFAYFSIKRRFPRWGTSLIDIWALCFSSHLAKYPEFSECGPAWTKKDLAASLQLRYDEFSLGLCTDADGVQRVGFDTASVGREHKQTGFVAFVKTKEKDPVEVAHCFRCADKPEFHKSDEAKRQALLLSGHYRRGYKQPIDRERGVGMPE